MCGIPDGHLPNIRSEVLLVVLTLVIRLIEKYIVSAFLSFLSK